MGTVASHEVRDLQDVVVTQVLRVVDEERDLFSVGFDSRELVQASRDIDPLGLQCGGELIEQRRLAGTADSRDTRVHSRLAIDDRVQELGGLTPADRARIQTPA